LLSSGVSITWAHHEILKRNFNKAKAALETTIFLGAIFTIFQGLEYAEAPFAIADSAFGSTFFIATGFHGLHVIIGSLFLIISLSRFKRIVNTKSHIVGFECAA
jgi:heme/copper-type cytochrome/quinol oxidase subunit 3